MAISQAMRKKIKDSKTKDRISLKVAYQTAQELIKKLGLKNKNPYTLKPDQEFIENIAIIGGSIRRKKETIGDIDLLVTSHISEEQLRNTPGVEEIWSESEKQLYFNYKSDEGIWRPINIWECSDPHAFGSFLIHVTGSRPYNIMLRSKAKYKGFKLNQYGLFNAETNRYLAGKSEESIFKALGMDWSKPWNREK
ncbi:hypothetical protein HOM50_01900 [bacterium]|jgi:DNA polymerase (family X)|nr:hypothetical protein [bacterium]MBT5015141.1 hypothetical protein [bacterium]